jgi:hypothetical protein
MLYQQADDPRQPQTREQKLVHFADKLCEGAQLVAPPARITALKRRYPRATAELEASRPLLHNLQEDICTAFDHGRDA